MTATLNPETTSPATEVAPEAPQVPTDYHVGHITITAASEEEALRKYKRLVRAEGLKAQIANDWCDSGTNDKLARLGLRLKGEGIPVRVRLVAERIAYMVLDVDTEDEANELLATGEDPETLELATAAIGRGWKAQIIEKAPPRTGEYKVGDPDDTTSAMRIGSGSVSHVPACEQYSSTRGYCTRPRGHIDAGDLQHVVGNGHVIVAVWNGRRPTAPGPGPGDPVVDEVFDDYARGGERCEAVGGGYTCTRTRGHTGPHAGAYSNRLVGHVWPNEG